MTTCRSPRRQSALWLACSCFLLAYVVLHACAPVPDANVTVYVTRTGTRYHRATCYLLRRQVDRIGVTGGPSSGVATRQEG